MLCIYIDLTLLIFSECILPSDFPLLQEGGGGGVGVRECARSTCVPQGLVRVRILFPNLLSMEIFSHGEKNFLK